MKTCVCRDWISHKPTEILWLTPSHQGTRIPLWISCSLLGHIEPMCWSRQAQGWHSPAGCKSAFFSLKDYLTWIILHYLRVSDFLPNRIFFHIFQSQLLLLNWRLDCYIFSTKINKNTKVYRSESKKHTQ